MSRDFICERVGRNIWLNESLMERCEETWTADLRKKINLSEEALRRGK